MAIDGFSNTEWELVIDPVYGERGFLIDPYSHRLTGLTYSQYEFEDGVNTSECGNKEALRSRNLVRAAGGKKKLDVDAEHDMSDHFCGFWAYFTNAKNQFGSPHVRGILEATGKTVLGTEGFRSEKGKIVALFPVEKANNSRWQRFKRLLYPSYDWYTGSSWLNRRLSNMTVTTLILTFIVTALLVTGGAMVAGRAVGFPWLATPVGMLWGYWVGGFIRRLGLNKQATRELTRQRGTWGRISAFTPEFLEQTAVLYPSAKLFETRAEALKAFPLTDPPQPTAEERAAALKAKLDRATRSRAAWRSQHYATGGTVGVGQIQTGNITAAQIKAQPSADDLLRQLLQRDSADLKKRIDDLHRKYGRYNY